MLSSRVWVSPRRYMDFNILREMVGVECDYVDIEIHGPRLEGSPRRDMDFDVTRVIVLAQKVSSIARCCLVD